VRELWVGDSSLAFHTDHIVGDAGATTLVTGAAGFIGVMHVSQLLGKKNIRTDEPTERVDKKILEVLVQLDEGSRVAALAARADARISINVQSSAKAGR